MALPLLALLASVMNPATMGAMAGTGAAAGAAGISSLIGPAMLAGAGVSGLMGLFGKNKGYKEPASDYKATAFTGGNPLFPDEEYVPGKDPEWNYYPGFAGGGLVSPPEDYVHGKMPEWNFFPGGAQAGGSGGADGMGGFGLGGLFPLLAGMNATGGNPPTEKQLQVRQGFQKVNDIFTGLFTKLAGGTPIRPEWAGGAAPQAPAEQTQQLAMGGPVMRPMVRPPMMPQGMPMQAPQMGMGGPMMNPLMPPQMQRFAEGGPIPVPPAASPMPMQQPTQPDPAGPSNEKLIEMAAAAIQGKVPNPQQVLQIFVMRFGEEALQDLKQKIMGLPVTGPGSGTSDSIPAIIDGQQPAKLSSGEFVMPADVVKGIGGGDPNAGVGQLQEMMKMVRQQRNA